MIVERAVMSIQKVLVVDDSRTELVHLTEMLVSSGYQVETAQNVTEAQVKLEQCRPDLILMDVVMPGKNGFQFTREIMRDPRFANTPVIMCTSKNQETDRLWGMRQGARAYIVKPIQKEDLMAKIRSLG
jgi:twitching motility two-component system response regulator PilH